jgi:hypothetical protein
MSSTLTDLTAATTWSGTDLFYALVGGNSRKIAAAKFLVAETSSSLSMQDSTTAQTFRIYRTFTDSSNYERLSFSSGAGYFSITAETAGTGTDNIGLAFFPTGTGSVNFVGQLGILQNLTISAGGSAAMCLTYGQLILGTIGFGIYAGSGVPTVTAGQGSLYLRSDGSSTSTRLYVNSSATSGTAWTAVTTAT